MAHAWPANADVGKHRHVHSVRMLHWTTPGCLPAIVLIFLDMSCIQLQLRWHKQNPKMILGSYSTRNARLPSH